MSLTPTASPYLARNREAHLQRWGIGIGGSPSPRVSVEARPADIAGAASTSWPAGQILCARVLDQADTWVRMHSDRAPFREAESLWQSLQPTVGEATTLALVGAGLGYLLDVIETDSNVNVLVLEPEAGFVPWLLARRDWSALIRAGRLLILEGPTFDAAPRAWGILARAPRATPSVVVHPVTSRTCPDAAGAAGRALTSVVHASRANALARRRFEAAYLVNTLHNVGAMPEAPPVEVFDGAARGRPVVIAGAGPSLNRNIEQLRPYRDNVVLVATDTALAPLLEAALAPDIVVAVDPGPLNARHLSDVTVPETTWLVAEASIDPASFKPFGDRCVLFRVADHAPWRWLTRVGFEPGTLRAWGSVITSAFDLALRLQGSSIAFIGADLAYTDGQPYCRGTRYEDDWKEAMARTGQGLQETWNDATRAGTVRTPDVEGRETRTAPHLLAYRDWLARACADATATSGSRRIVNATGAGILHGPAIAQATLHDTLGAVATRAHAFSAMTMPRRPPANSDTARHPADAHLVNVLLAADLPAPPTLPPPAVTPYMGQARAQRIRDTRRLREARGTDTARWRDPDNLDVSWERRAAAAGRLVPPGSRVLDLGAGREALERYLPPDAVYQPADVVLRSPRTRLIDVNAGRLPGDHYDVVAVLGLLEYVHAPTTLLRTLTRRTDLLIISYCVVTKASPDARLQRGWMNDFTLSAWLDILKATGWDVAWATRLDTLDDFDQWLMACRPGRQA